MTRCAEALAAGAYPPLSPPIVSTQAREAKPTSLVTDRCAVRVALGAGQSVSSCLGDIL